MLFLGTSSATPTKSRNVSALALLEDTGKAWTLVDCGEATQHQLLHAPLSLADLQAVFITHVHGDHCYGLPGLLASAGLQGRKTPLQIIAPAGIEDWINATLQHTRLFLPFTLEFLATESLAQWKHNNWLVDAIPLSHRVPSFAYRFTEASTPPTLDQDKLAADGIPRGHLWGELRNGLNVEHEGRRIMSRDYIRYRNPVRRIVVAGDNDRPELLRDACVQAQVLIHEATYTTDIADKIGVRTGHSTAGDVGSFAQSIGVPNLVLTHFSARYQSAPGHSPSVEDIRAEAAREYRGQLFLADDFSRFHLARDGQLQRVA